MPTARAGFIDVDDLPNPLRGRWWVPGKADPVGGTLTLATERSWELELHGGITADADPSWGIVVLGELDDGKYVTIPQAYRVARTGSLEGTEARFERWTCNVLFHGALLPRGFDEKFSYASLATESLPAWTGERPVEHHYPRLLDPPPEDPADHLLTVRTPKPIEAAVPIGDLALVWRESFKGGRDSYEVGLRPVWTLSLADSADYWSVWRTVVTPLVMFMTLVVGEPDLLVRLHLGLDEPEEEDEDGANDKRMRSAGVRVLTRSWMTLEPPRKRGSWGMPIRLDDIRTEFQSVMSTWFQLADELKAPLLEYFSVSLAGTMYGEDAFNRVVRALETWHRFREGGTLLDEKRFGALLTKLRAALWEDEREFVLGRLQYANELTLKRRLDALIEAAGQPLTLWIKGYRKFARRVVMTRNNMTHGTADPLVFSTDEMSYARGVLELLMMVTIFRALGLSDTLIAEAVGRSDNWHWISQPDNPL